MNIRAITTSVMVAAATLATIATAPAFATTAPVTVAVGSNNIRGTQAGEANGVAKVAVSNRADGGGRITCTVTIVDAKGLPAPSAPAVIKVADGKRIGYWFNQLHQGTWTASADCGSGGYASIKLYIGLVSGEITDQERGFITFVCSKDQANMDYDNHINTVSRVYRTYIDARVIDGKVVDGGEPLHEQVVDGSSGVRVGTRYVADGTRITVTNGADEVLADANMPKVCGVPVV